MSRRARLAVAALAVAVLAAWFHSTYAFDGVALFDEGLLADGAVRVLDGERLGRDAFVPYGPASYWVLAPVFQTFGASLGVLRATTVVLQALCDGGLFLLAATTATIPGALLTAGFLIVAHGSLHKSFLVVATLLVLLALKIVARRGEGGGRGGLARALDAGACLGVAFLFRHDVGAFGAVALLAVVTLERTWLTPRLAGAAAGFLATVAPAAVVLLFLGLDPRAWWDHEWQRIAVQERIAVAFPWPAGADGWRWGRAFLSTAIVLAPCVHLAWGGAALVRIVRGTKRDGDAARAGAALFGLLLLNQARLIPSANHLFQAMAPLALALGDLLARRQEPARPPAPTKARSLRGALAGHGALALLFAALVAWCATMRDGPYSGTFTQRLDHGVALDLPTGGVRLDPTEAQVLAALVRAIDERSGPGDFLVTSPGCPLIGFLARRRLALPYAEPAYYYHETRFQEEAIAALERRRPKLFVHDPRPAATFTMERDAPLVARWLAQRYRPVARFDRFTLLELRP
jgi:hypothetical protein